jgi:hypothetical protein
MAYKSILTILTETDDAAPFWTPRSASPRAGAHLDVLCLGIDRTQTGYYFAGATALMHEETLARRRPRRPASKTVARDRLGRTDISWGVEAMVAQSASVTTIVARHARFSDLVILPKPYGEGLPSRCPCGGRGRHVPGSRPVVVLAGNATDTLDAKRIVVAWNDWARGHGRRAPCPAASGEGRPGQHLHGRARTPRFDRPPTPVRNCPRCSAATA